MKLVTILTVLSCGLLTAAPELRLATATVGPVFVASGQNAPTQSVAANNIGDGSLALAASSNVTWITPSISGSTVQLGFATSTLAAGSYSGVVTVSAPGAIDAPQNIAVTVQVGSPVPNSVDLYLPPGGTASTTFNLAAPLFASVKNPSNGATLTAFTFGGSFLSPSDALEIEATAPASAAAGNYPGSVTTTGSTSPADNKTIAVTAHVTTQPIAAASSARVTFRIVQNAQPVMQAVAFTNSGQGTLTASGVTISVPWLTATTQGSAVFFTANPGSMNPGGYQTTATIQSNAANGPTPVAVELDVLATGPPVAYYQGVLDNALFAIGDPLAPGGIVALFGEQLTSGPTTQAQKLPLGTSLGGATVLVNGAAAPIYYVSATQLDFVIPYGTAPGPALVQVQRDGQTGNTVSIVVQAKVPRLLRLGIADYGIALLSDNVTYAIPTTPGLPSRPAQAGVDTVVFYALGLGQTSPPAQDGQPSGATQVSAIQAVIGQSVLPNTGVTVTPAYAGLTPGSVGLYQVNVPIPSNVQRGNAISVFLQMGGSVYSNHINIAIQ